MGRWESTRQISPFRGHWTSVIIGKNRRRTAQQPKRDRIEEIEQKKREEKTDSDYEITLADLQNISDYYGIPTTQAEKEPMSAAEYIDTYGDTAYADALENYRWQLEVSDPILSKWIEDYDPNDGMTKQEYFKQMKRALPRKGKQSVDQMIKLAEQCGVGWDYDDEGFLFFEDDRFEQAVSGVLFGQKEGLLHLSAAEQRKLIKKQYFDMLRDPNDDGAYEMCKTIVTRYYQIEEQVNDNGTPIGKYGKFIHNFNDLYDQFRREDKFPLPADIIYQMDIILKNTELERQAKRAESNEKRKESKRKDKYLKQHPKDKLLYNIGTRVGLQYNISESGKPVVNNAIVNKLSGTSPN